MIPREKNSPLDDGYMKSSGFGHDNLWRSPRNHVAISTTAYFNVHKVDSLGGGGKKGCNKVGIYYLI